MNQLQGVKYRWECAAADDADVSRVSQEHNLSRPIAATLVGRGLTDSTEITNYLVSTSEKMVGDARTFKGAEIAVARLIHAINNKEKILIFGDYDVDGITSTSLMLIALLPLAANINYFLPNRVRDGYGLSSKIVKRAVENGYKLIITVDNGISAYDAANTAQQLGIDLIITDHHRPHHHLPPALAIVNPQQEDCSYPFKTFAGVGVIFKLMHLLYQEMGKQLPDKVYELLMLGTVADVVPLQGENRYWVQHGLAKVNKQRSYAMQVLAQNAALNRSRWSSLDIGFMIAPQLNALGRLDDPRDAVKFLISARQEEVESVGAILKTMNEERKRIDRGIYDQIDKAIVNQQIDITTERIIMAAHDEWPAGVIGLVAGKLMHSYGRPTLLFHLSKNGIAKGSCRSIAAFNIFDALDRCSDLLISFGGHSCAAGLQIEASKLPQLKERLEADMAERFTFQELQPKIHLDATIELGDLTKKCMSDLTFLEPFGNQNPQPLFRTQPVTQLNAPTLLKDAHVKTTLFADGIIKPVIFFNRPDLYPILNEMGEKSFTVAGHAVTNEWQERITIEMQGVDIAL